MLEMLPYPSGSLHMGHVLNYTLGDVVTHFKRRHGYTVLRPMGFDSFGLPAENAAIKDGGHPLEITERNMEAIRVQMRRMGWAIDWQREVSAHEPTFYRWTQWLFLKFFEHGLDLPQGGAGQLVPVRPDRARERARRRRPLLALRQRSSRRGTWRSGSSRSPTTPTSCSPTWRRIDWPERTKKIQTRLDRPLRRRGGAVPRRGARHRHPGLHDPSRHAVRRDVLRRRARVAARRASSPATTRRCCSYARDRRGARRRRSASSARRPASSPAATRRTR